MIQSFLMIGQSNMAGRGFIKDVPPIFDEGIKMLRNGKWQTMVEPVNYDRPTSGVSLAASFAAAWRLQHTTEEIGLIPCAEGGACLDEWLPGEVLFDHAIALARLAMRSSTITGILWHQGESDCFPGRAAVYEEKFASIVLALRQELVLLSVPLVIGGLGDFLTSGLYGQYFATYPLVNEALYRFAQAQPDCYFVTASGLTANPDGLHFDAVSQRLLGIRYFEAFSQRRHVTEPLQQESALLKRIYERPFTQKEKIALLENSFACGNISLEEFKRRLGALQQE